MKRKVLFLLTALLLTLALTATSFATVVPPRLWDGADVLEEDDERRLLSRLDSLSDELSLDLVIVTVPTTEGKTPGEFADDYYDYQGFGDDGMLLLLAMEERQMWISTSGACIDAVSDGDIDAILDLIESDMHAGLYAEGFTAYIDACEIYAVGNSDDVGPRYFTLAIISIVIGLIVALIVTGSMRAQLKSVRSKSEAFDYMKADSMQITEARDLYLYRTVIREKKPESSSSTHRSSSGRSHGGGGRGF